MSIGTESAVIIESLDVDWQKKPIIVTTNSQVRSVRIGD